MAKLTLARRGLVAIRSILAGDWPGDESLLRLVAKSIPDSAVHDRIEDLLPLESPPLDAATQFGATGWVVDTVPLALYCAQFISGKPLEVVLAQAIEAGGDTDTIASIAGQIAGTVAGFPADHKKYFSRITEGEEIIKLAGRFADFVSMDQRVA